MSKLTPSQKEILQHLLHEEPYDRLRDELNMHEGALRDDLRQLVAFGYVESRLTGGDGNWAFDTDHMHFFSYQATSKGLRVGS